MMTETSMEVLSILAHMLAKADWGNDSSYTLPNGSTWTKKEFYQYIEKMLVVAG